MDEKENAAHVKACEVLRCHIRLQHSEAKLEARKKECEAAADALVTAKRELVNSAYNKTFVVGDYAVIVTTSVANGVLIQKVVTSE